MDDIVPIKTGKVSYGSTLIEVHNRLVAADILLVYLLCLKLILGVGFV